MPLPIASVVGSSDSLPVPLHATVHPAPFLSDGNPAPPPTVAGWQLGPSLGSGSLTTVYAARPQSLPTDDWDYAVKILHAKFSDDSFARQALAAEGHLGKTVSHPNLIPVLSSNLQGPLPFLVLPRLEGATARLALTACQRFTVPQSLWVARQVAQGLQAIHAAGWVHGDVKPDNIFLSPDGHCTLFDLGFAAPTAAQNRNFPQILKGTLRYIAPELLVSRLHHPCASDIYSLGVTLFELLTGRLPFEFAAPGRLIEAHLREQPTSPRHYLPNLAPDIAKLVQMMLAKSPERRPTADEIIEQLKRLEIATFSFR